MICLFLRLLQRNASKFLFIRSYIHNFKKKFILKRELESFKKCAVTVLEECEEPTTANLAEAAFRFIRGKTPCANIEVSSSE